MTTEKYKILLEKIYTSEDVGGTAKFGHMHFEQRIKAAIENKDIGIPPGAEMCDPHLDPCRTFVVAMSQDFEGSTATRMRTYKIGTVDASPVRISEAASATTAHTFFASIFIDDIDGRTTRNNPTKEAIAEAYNIWPERRIGCLVSIGMALEDPNQWNEHTEKLKFIDAVLRLTSSRLSFTPAIAECYIKCLTSCEKIHQEVAENPEKNVLYGSYFRLNVPQGISKIGLADWEKLEDIIALSEGYMKQGELLKRMQIIAKLLLNPEHTGQSF